MQAAIRNSRFLSCAFWLMMVRLSSTSSAGSRSLDVELAGFDFGEVEDVVDDPERSARRFTLVR